MCAAARQALALLGEFNTWEPQPEHWAIKNDFGVWSLFLPDGADGSPVIAHRWAPMQTPAEVAWAAHLLLRTEPAWPGGPPGLHSVKPCIRATLPAC